MHKCKCKHELKFCEVCEKVYCTKCGIEWIQDISSYIIAPNPDHLTTPINTPSTGDTSTTDIKK